MTSQHLEIYKIWLKERGFDIENHSALIQAYSEANSQAKYDDENLSSDLDNSSIEISLPPPWIATALGLSQHKYHVYMFSERSSQSPLEQREHNLLLNIFQAMQLQLSPLRLEPHWQNLKQISALVFKKHLSLQVIDYDPGLTNTFIFFAPQQYTYALRAIFRDWCTAPLQTAYPAIYSVKLAGKLCHFAVLYSLSDMLMNTALKKPVWNILKDL